MKPERREQIEDLCLAVLDRTEAQRAFLLDDACAGDEALRQEVESLIKYEGRAKTFIEAPALEVAASIAVADLARSLIGQQINHYRILSLLGVGGMGDVYLAEDATLHRRIALKLLPAEFTKDPKRVQRFKQEARAISALNHPNIITIYEIGEAGGTHYIATEFIDGQTLRRRINETMPIGEVVDVAVQVAGALGAAHESGVVHRDIKPENVMVRKDGLVKVLDFGVAKLTESEASGVDSGTETKDAVQTQTGALMGTVQYMSPEQASGMALDSRSDIFSLGVVLHEMLAGKSPFEGENTAEVFTAILGQEPPPARSCRSDAPEALERIVTRALRKQVDERYQTARQMITELKELKHRLDIEAAHGATITTVEARSAEAVPALDGAQQVVRLPRAHNMWRRIGVGLLALVVVGGLAWYPRPTSVPPAWESIPLTSYPGVERNPALSPDGNTVAFIWNGEAPGNFDIYVLSIGSNRPQRLTTDPAEDTSPAWSPDGKTIAFLRRINAERSQLILIPAAGGQERVLTETRFPVMRGTGGSTLRSNLAWTPGNGDWIAVPHWEDDESPRGLSLVSVWTGNKRPLTEPPAGYFDEHPAFALDGSLLAFARRPGVGGSDLYLLPLSEGFTAGATLKRLTTTGQASQPAWTSDGRQIVYIASAQVGPLRTIAVSASSLSGRALLESETADFSLGQHLVYSIGPGRGANIWRAEIRSEGPPVAPQLFVSSTYGETSPEFSPDGKRIAFRSSRSGTAQIWISNADGSSPVQLTSLSSSAFYPMWSPDGGQILFHARLDGQAGADLFSISAAGGSPKQLTTERSDDYLASYSRDGHWIYFTSNRSGQPEIWKMPVGGGHPSRITDGGALMPFENWDGKTLFYAHRNPERGIWRIPVQGGDARQVTGPIAKDTAFAVGQNGVYYVAPLETPTRQLIWFLSFSTGQSRPVVEANREIGLGLSLSSDENYLLFAQRDGAGSDLMLVKDFLVPN